MTTKAQLRKAASGLPETASEQVAGLPAYTVHGAVFAALTADNRAELRLGSDSLVDTLQKFPAAEQSGPETLLVPLAEVNGMQLNGLVYRAWLHCAPSELAARAQAAKRTDDSGTDHGLPAAIGRPATRALLLAGIRTLDQVADHTEMELLALHGVGPRAVRLLREALAERQLAFQEQA